MDVLLVGERLDGMGGEFDEGSEPGSKSGEDGEAGIGGEFFAAEDGVEGEGGEFGGGALAEPGGEGGVFAEGVEFGAGELAPIGAEGFLRADDDGAGGEVAEALAMAG